VNQILPTGSTAIPHGPLLPSTKLHSVKVALPVAAGVIAVAFGIKPFVQKTSMRMSANVTVFLQRPTVNLENIDCTRLGSLSGVKRVFTLYEKPTSKFEANTVHRRIRSKLV